jgi:L-lysine 2,3-aminomutase
MRFATVDTGPIVAFLKAHPEISQVLITGGDAMIMKPDKLREILADLLSVESITDVRLGTKALAYWPRKFVSDPGYKELLQLFRDITSGRFAGRKVRLAVMAHFTHPAELDSWVLRRAVQNILRTGAEIFTQAPVVAHINDAPVLWRTMWTVQGRLGMRPYYMFIERDTGPQDFFAVPLGKVCEIFREAYRHLRGLDRTVRGPSMSCEPGKVQVRVADLAGQTVFVLEFIQHRDPTKVGIPFFAKFDPDAIWWHQLEPLNEADQRFFTLVA